MFDRIAKCTILVGFCSLMIFAGRFAHSQTRIAAHLMTFEDSRSIRGGCYQTVAHDCEPWTDTCPMNTCFPNSQGVYTCNANEYDQLFTYWYTCESGYVFGAYTCSPDSWYCRTKFNCYVFCDYNPQLGRYICPVNYNSGQNTDLHYGAWAAGTECGSYPY